MGKLTTDELWKEIELIEETLRLTSERVDDLWIEEGRKLTSGQVKDLRAWYEGDKGELHHWRAREAKLKSMLADALRRLDRMHRREREHDHLASNPFRGRYPMISILITLLVVCIIAALVFWIISILPLPQPWLNIIRAIVGVIIIIWLLLWLLPAAHLPLR